MPVEIYGPYGEIGPQGPRSINWINAAWAAATDYSVDDALEHNGTTYRVTADHTSAAATEPGVGVDWATVWAVVAEKGAPGGGATDLDGLTDVDLTTTPPADGDGIFFDSASGLWLPSAPAAGGGGGGITRVGYAEQTAALTANTTPTLIPGLSLTVTGDGVSRYRFYGEVYYTASTQGFAYLQLWDNTNSAVRQTRAGLLENFASARGSIPLTKEIVVPAAATTYHLRAGTNSSTAVMAWHATDYQGIFLVDKVT